MYYIFEKFKETPKYFHTVPSYACCITIYYVLHFKVDHLRNIFFKEVGT